MKFGASSGRLMAMSERRTLPIGEAIGTLAVMFAMVLIEAGDAVRLLSKSESCLRQIFSMVGTPNMIDVLGDFSHENQITKAWYRSDQSKHPHAFREDVPLGALKTETSPHFRENLDAFSNFVNHFVISGTKPDELQLFRFLMEVRFAVDTIIAIV